MQVAISLCQPTGHAWAERCPAATHTASTLADGAARPKPAQFAVHIAHCTCLARGCAAPAAEAPGRALPAAPALYLARGGGVAGLEEEKEEGREGHGCKAEHVDACLRGCGTRGRSEGSRLRENGILGFNERVGFWVARKDSPKSMMHAHARIDH